MASCESVDDHTVRNTYAYDENKLIAEADGQGRATYAYAYIGWRPVAQLVLRPDNWWPRMKAWLFGASARQLHTDRAGQVVAMSDAQGQVVWRLPSQPARPTRPIAVIKTASEQTGSPNEPNNEPATEPGTEPGIHQPLRYVGQYHDDESALDYHGARYYEARSGRFISPDPEGMADAVNEVAAPYLLDLYAYAAGRPQDYFDPDGAARIRYYAITTGANGRAIGTNNGFVQARWAFMVDNVQTGSDSSPIGSKRNEYAASQTNLLVDPKGNFLAANVSVP